MICPSCGTANRARESVCQHCGTRLTPPRRRLRRGRLAALLALMAGGFCLLALIRVSQQLPSTAHLGARFKSSPSSLVYDSQGKIIARLGGPVRQAIPLSRISPQLDEAVIAVEDHSFYQNPGFDIRSIARAALVDIRHRAPLQGASTITEQLAKNLFLSDQKSLSRKIQEFLLGIELAHQYSKNTILDMYLNAVYYGQGAEGIKAAAHIYFDTTPARLSLAQASLLAGLPQAPSAYDPITHMREAKERQRQVLDAMVRYHDISPASAQRAFKAPLGLHPKAPTSGSGQYPYPWYVDRVISELLSHGFTMNQILYGGLRIHTALRPQAYQAAQAAVDQWMNKNFGKSKARYPHHEASAIVENPKNGHVWAIIGGRRHFTFLQEDLALDSNRSTGSTIKPLLDYAPALAKGYTEMSVVQDVPLYQNVQGQSWWPANDDNQYRGYINLKDALAISDNDAAVHVLKKIGLAYGISFLRQHFAISVPASQAHNLGSALGVNTSLLAMTRAYGALDNSGRLLQPVFVTQVTWHRQVLFHAPVQTRQALTPQEAFLLTNMLEGVLNPHPLKGIGPGALATGSRLGIGRPAAAKSGTNTQESDAWFIGYEPQILVGVWEGNRVGEIAQPYTDSGSGPAYGAVAAGPIWQQIMRSVNQALHLKPQRFSQPPGLIYVRRISITSGKRAGAYTPLHDIQGGWYIAGTQPRGMDHLWHPLRVLADNPARRWRPGCGPYLVMAALRRESAWHPGVPKPWDARFWGPSATCSVKAKQDRPAKIFFKP